MTNMTPIEIIKKLKDKGISAAEIASAVDCTVYYINKIASGERKNPNYQIVDKLRDFYSKAGLQHK